MNKQNIPTPGGMMEAFANRMWQQFFINLGQVFKNGDYLVQYTVAQLPAGKEGYIAYATNGRKTGEGAGAGTGVPVYYSNGKWRVFYNDSQVVA